MRTVAALAVLALLSATSSISSLEGQDRCSEDASVVIHDMTVNYAGAADAIRLLGPEALGAVEERLREQASMATGATCDTAIRAYLSVFDDRHVQLRSESSEREDPRGDRPGFPCCSPSITGLAPDVALVRIPSFAIRHREPLERLIEEHRTGLLALPYWVIDVRGNGGGGDATYSALLDLISSGPIPRDGVSFLSTPDNRNRWRALLEQVPESEVGVRTQVRELLDALDATPDGQFAVAVESGTTKLGPGLSSLEKVALLTDRWCGSACDQFVLEASQSQRVTQFGEETAWVIDYSNLLPSQLPSGTRTLSYPSSRSLRLDRGRASEPPVPEFRLSADLLRDLRGGQLEAARMLTGRE